MPLSVVSQLCCFDFSGAKGKLVASVPGVHPIAADQQYGFPFFSSSSSFLSFSFFINLLVFFIVPPLPQKDFLL